LNRNRSPKPPRRRALKVALGLGVVSLAALALAIVATAGAFGAYANKVVPGVHAGSVDLSGLNRDQVVARLQSAYAYLGQGEVKIKTPVGTATVSYQQAGRVPDVKTMADAAMRVGHTGDPISDAVAMVQSATGGRVVPIAVSVDPKSVASRVHEVVVTDKLPAQNARATVKGASFALSPATVGSSLDEIAITAAIVGHLEQPDAAVDFQAGGAFLTLDPQISDTDAQAAIAAAQKMTVGFDLSLNGSPAAASSKPALPARTFHIDAETVRNWISFGTTASGAYGPSIDATLVDSYVYGLSASVSIAPVEPTHVTFTGGVAVSLTGGRDGATMDVEATTQSIVKYLDGLATGGTVQPTIFIATTPLAPKVTLESMTGMTVIGGWTTVFYPGISNGFGANIRVPAKLLNGLIIAPGQHFSFLAAVSPVDPAHGYTLGGVIESGKSNHTGAMGGGICSASTTMFNAAARAGLQIDERHAHYYYIDRYPVGLDATVFDNGAGQRFDLRWTNDTPNPIVIESGATYGSTSKITIQLLSAPTNRKVSFTPEFKANVVRAGDRTVYVSTLKPGQQNRAEYPTPGFSTSRTRTVTDLSGRVIHQNTWNSHYYKVDGLLQIGKSKPKPPPTAPPAPVQIPATLPGTPASMPSGRPRRVR
jgi:vancomycin resistance protein YoaR